MLCLIGCTPLKRVYGGGNEASLRRVLDESIIWTFPGASSIAGTYVRSDAVVGYFRRRRDLAAGTFRMTLRDLLAGHGSRIAALTDRAATISGTEHRWSTVGLYEVADGRIVICWLLPLHTMAFDAIWTAR